MTASTGTKLNSSLVTTSGFNDYTVALDTQYYYVVTAVDGAGNESVVSNEATGKIASVPDTEAPVAPTALAAVAGDATVTLGVDRIDLVRRCRLRGLAIAGA